MIPLIGLPKNVWVRTKWTELIINNHQVTEPDSLMRWVLCAIKYADWDYAVPQLINQGFGYHAFREQCIEDLRNPEKLLEIFSVYPTYNHSEKLAGFVQTETAVKIAQSITRKIEKCGDWYQFVNTMRWTCDFHKKITEKLMEGLKTCEN